MFKGCIAYLGAVAVTFSVIGCGSEPTTATTENSKPPADSANYKASTEPAGALPVGDARKSAKDEDKVVLVGRIGGSVKPFVDGIAAFTIVDPKVPYCAEEEGCPTPWDYCCEQNAVKENIATVKLVDADGKPVMQDARELLGVKELNMVVVQGVASRDEEGNLSVQADQVFVKE